MPKTDFTLMRKALEKRLEVDTLPEKETPHPDHFFNVKMDQVGAGEPEATPLDEIMFKGEAESGVLEFSKPDSTGTWRQMRSKVKGTTARTEESLRTKMKCEGNAWSMLATKFITISWLNGITRQEQQCASIGSS